MYRIEVVWPSMGKPNTVYTVHSPESVYRIQDIIESGPGKVLSLTWEPIWEPRV